MAAQGNFRRVIGDNGFRNPNKHNSYDAYDDQVSPVYNGRPMPPELQSLFTTLDSYDPNGDDDVNYHLKECMEEFSSCMYVKAKQPLCGVNIKNGQKRVFSNLCQMFYENCRSGSDSAWTSVDEKNCFRIASTQR
ncbi:uncharacterized protein LOC113232563 [Hyposmocoma kahamanoa]|uniref:uncharacterized protein LOC113232563 n=1 Tax=Hyposmocoma kahamanoa TaxID=1477025 RepID=UPI000E6D8C04|nr:uncharacterized protein LOC113232563 [Hyposmocoma kahamanoa]